MKKVLIVLLLVASIFLLAGCEEEETNRYEVPNKDGMTVYYVSQSATVWKVSDYLLKNVTVWDDEHEATATIAVVSSAENSVTPTLIYQGRTYGHLYAGGMVKNEPMRTYLFDIPVYMEDLDQRALKVEPPAGYYISR